MKTWHSFVAVLASCVTVVAFLQRPLEKRQDALEQSQTEQARKLHTVSSTQSQIKEALGDKIEKVNARLSDSREALSRIEAEVNGIRRQLDDIARRSKISSTEFKPSPLSRAYSEDPSIELWTTFDIRAHTQ